jgi:hypothetical protein
MSYQLTTDGDVISQRQGLDSGLITNFQFKALDADISYNSENEINAWNGNTLSWNKNSGIWKSSNTYTKIGDQKQTELYIRNPNITSAQFDKIDLRVNVTDASFFTDRQGLVMVTNNHPTFVVTGVYVGGSFWNGGSAQIVLYFSGKDFPIYFGQVGYFFRDYNGPTGGQTLYSGTGIGSAAAVDFNSGQGTGGTQNNPGASWGSFFVNDSQSPGAGRIATLLFR